jgi:hypothetical protein
MDRLTYALPEVSPFFCHPAPISMPIFDIWGQNSEVGVAVRCLLLVGRDVDLGLDADSAQVAPPTVM